MSVSLPGGATTWGSWQGNGGGWGMAPAALWPLLVPRGTSTCSVGHLHTLLNLEVLFLAQACDPAGQHATVRPEELTEQQDILVEMENRRRGSAGWTLDGGEPGHVTARGGRRTLAFQEVDVSLGNRPRLFPPQTALHTGLLHSPQQKINLN